MRRSRTRYVLLALVTVALGLASRARRDALPAFLGTYAGDALWAAMVYFAAAALWPRARTRVLAACAGGFALAIELSQLYHAPWIDAVRATRGGALVLGQGFRWSDLGCYAVGIGLAAGVDLLVRAGARRNARRSSRLGRGGGRPGPRDPE